MTIEQKIRELSDQYRSNLKDKIDARVVEMENDDDSHSLIYQVLGVTNKEGKKIDVYQNKGRFLYKYAGSFLEAATKLCFLEKFEDSGSVRIPNTEGVKPKTFEIDCLVGTDAIEIKWRDATTDGDHITKEHTRMTCVSNAGYKPIRVMFFYPNRKQAMKIQKTLETLYEGIGGEYYFGDGAWDYVEQKTDISLKNILENIASENIFKIMIEKLVAEKGVEVLDDELAKLNDLFGALSNYAEESDIELVKSKVENGLDVSGIVDSFKND